MAAKQAMKKSAVHFQIWSFTYIAGYLSCRMTDIEGFLTIYGHSDNLLNNNWIYTLIFKPNYLLQKFFSLKQTKQTTHKVLCQSLLSHGRNFSAGLYIKQGSSWGSLQRFTSSSLQLNRCIILPFSELMKNEPHHHLVLNCLHSTFAVERLPNTLPFRSVFHAQRNVTLRRVQSLFLSVMFFYKNNLPDSLRWDKVDDIASYFLNVFVEICFLVP